MDSQLPYATKDDIWRLQETLGEISATQAHQTERIMRLERRRDDDTRVKSVWGPSSPFTSVLGSSHADSGLNPAAEAFRNFAAETPTALMSSLSLDNQEESRRAAASRANSVRFDESANNHYGASSRQSIDLPTRTGSGLGSHPLSERSLSHRSDGRGSTAGFGQRTNSFGLEQSRLLGSIHNSPRVSGNPPPGFFVLGPFPAIVRCWLTGNFSKESLLYTALCTGSYSSCITYSLVASLSYSDRIFEQDGGRKIKLSVYLTEAKVQYMSSRSDSPSLHVPTITATFDITEATPRDKSIQIILGSDILREHGADILLSQDKVTLLDDDHNQLSVPLIRPEDQSVYRNLTTIPGLDRDKRSSRNGESTLSNEDQIPGIFSRPGPLNTDPVVSSPTMASPSVLTSAAPSDVGEARRQEPGSEGTARSSTEQARTNDDSKSTTGSEKSFAMPLSKSSSGVWANSWRATSSQAPVDLPSTTKTASTYARAGTSRPMKVLRPSKPSTTISRNVSAMQANGVENVPFRTSEPERKSSQPNIGDAKPAATKANPIGSASAFGWLNSGQPKRTAANGE